MKENQHVKPVIAADFGTITFEVKGHPTLTLNIGKIHADVLKRAACVGLAQVRVVDAAAIPATRKDGTIMPEAERLALKHSRMAELIEHLESGSAEWSRVSEGGGGKSITIEAIARVQGVDYAKAETDVEEFAKRDPYKGDTKKALAFLRTGKRVMEAMEAIRKERTPAPVVDADAALNDLKAA